MSTADSDRSASSKYAKDEFAYLLSLRGGCEGSPEPVYARPARITEEPPDCGYGYYGSQEATTAGHRRMVVRGRLMCSDRVSLIFVVVRNSLEGPR